ncbi:hypothetical protein CLOM_g18841 [Closterium sp. NIES-68]|nr:hypothetical protein CLOM_g18841 [Closterium sp. NIES-68]
MLRFPRIPGLALGVRPLMVLALLASICVIGWLSWELTAGQLGFALFPANSLEYQAARLYKQWQRAYYLDPALLLPPAAIALPSGVPPAPHLDDCAVRTAARQALEARGPGGEAPAWAQGAHPQPPWVRGSDAGNLGGTRAAQRDIWERQFPPHACRGRKLLLVRWLDMEYHGLGSQLHLIGAMLGHAMLFNRTLVIVPESFPQTVHEDCRAIGQAGSLDCYFFPIASDHCVNIAMQAYNEYMAWHGLTGRMPMVYSQFVPRWKDWWPWMQQQERRVNATRDGSIGNNGTIGDPGSVGNGGIVGRGANMGSNVEMERGGGKGGGSGDGNGEERGLWKGDVEWCGYDTKRTLESDTLVVFGCSPMLPPWAGGPYLKQIYGTAAE